MDTSVEKARKKIEALILDGTLSVGDRLPSERQLCQRLNASRPVIREAIKELCGMGIINTEHGKGSFVSDFNDRPEEQNVLHKIV